MSIEYDEGYVAGLSKGLQLAEKEYAALKRSNLEDHATGVGGVIFAIKSELGISQDD